MRTWDEAIEDPLYAVWVQGECKAFCEGFRNGWLDRSNGFRSIVADTAGGNFRPFRQALKRPGQRVGMLRSL